MVEKLLKNTLLAKLRFKSRLIIFHKLQCIPKCFVEIQLVKNRSKKMSLIRPKTENSASMRGRDTKGRPVEL